MNMFITPYKPGLTDRSAKRAAYISRFRTVNRYPLHLETLLVWNLSKEDMAFRGRDQATALR
jgi:hypothetical protein